MDVLLATNWFFDPIVAVLSQILLYINLGVHNLGLSLILLAAGIRLAFWGLNVAQFKAQMNMVKVGPKLKKLQERFKADPKKLQEEQMALYKESGVNPLAGCWPMLVQLPILFSVYWVVIGHRNLYEHTSFLWVGSALSAQFPKVLASSLAHPDLLMILIYMVSQYISMRFTTMPATDKAQANQYKVMQVVSPLMIGFFGYRANWPSAMVLYWFAYNFFTMAQQLYMLRKYHEPLSFLDSEHAVTDIVPDAAAVAAAPAPKALTTRNITATSNKKKYKKKTTKGGA